MANVDTLRLVFDGQRSAVDTVQHHIRRDPALLQCHEFHCRFNVHRIHGHVHSTHIPCIVDTRQKGKLLGRCLCN